MWITVLVGMENDTHGFDFIGSWLSTEVWVEILVNCGGIQIKNQVTLMFLLFNSAKVLILTYSDCFDSSTDVRWHSWPSSQSPDSNRTSAISRIAICGWCHELHWVHCDCMITVRGHRCEHWTVNHNNSPLLWLPGQQKGATDEDWDVCRQASYGLNQS